MPFDPDSFLQEVGQLVPAPPDARPFDPDEFLREVGAPAPAEPDAKGFDPDAFLREVYQPAPAAGSFDPDEFLSLATGTPEQAPPTPGDYARHIAGEIVRGAAEIPAGTLDFVSIGGAYLDPLVPEALGGQTGKAPGELETGKAGTAIRAQAAEIFPEDPRLKGKFWASTVPNAIGQMAGFIAPTAAAAKLAGRKVLTRAMREGMTRELTETALKKAAGSAVAKTTIALGGAVGGAAGYKDAVDNGADPEEAFYSFALNTVLGTSEAIPIAHLFKKLDQSTKGTLRRVLYESGTQAFEEALQEAFQGTAGNVIAKAIYAADRNYWEGVGTGAAAGGVTGAIAGALFSAIGGRRAKARPDRQDPTPVPESAETIRAQMQWLEGGKRQAVLITPGEDMPAYEDRFATLETRAGTFIYDPQQVTPKALAAAVTQDRIGEVLGYGLPARPEGADRAVVIRSAEGIEKQAVVATEDTQAAALEAAQRIADQTDTITIETPNAILAGRIRADRWKIEQPLPGPFKTFSPAMPETDRADWERMLAQLPNDGARLRAIKQLGQDPREFGFWSAEELEAEKTARFQSDDGTTPEQRFDPDAFLRAAEAQANATPQAQPATPAPTGTPAPTDLPGLAGQMPAPIRFTRPEPFPGPNLTFTPALDDATRQRWAIRLPTLPNDPARRNALRRAGIDPREFNLWTRAEKNAEQYARNRAAQQEQAAKVEQWHRDQQRQAAEARATAQVDEAETQKRRKLEAAQRAMQEATRKAELEKERLARWAAMDENDVRDRAAAGDQGATQELVRRHGEDFPPALMQDLADREERIAAETAQDQAEADARAEIDAENTEHFRHNSYELLDAVRQVGGLPLQDELTGELARIRQAAPNAAMRLMRRSQRKGLDKIRGELRDYGFYFETPGEMLAALEDRLTTGKKVYGTQFETAGLEFSRQRTPDPTDPGDAWRDSLADLLSNPDAAPLEPLTVGPVPPALRAAGISDAPLVMAASTVAKAMGTRHGLPRAIIEALPEALRDPVFVFDSATRPNAAVVLTEIRHAGKSVIAAIHLDRPSPNQPANVIASVYPKSNAAAVAGWMKSGLLRYANQAKAPRWFQAEKLPPQMEASKKTNPALKTEEDARQETRPGSLASRLQLPGEEPRAGSSENIPPPGAEVKPPPEWSRTREPGRREPTTLETRAKLDQAAAIWLDRLTRSFPALASELRLQFTSAAALVRSGLATPEELRGTEAAAYSHALRTVFLFDHLLDNPNSSDLIGRTIHEAAHAFWHTLPPALQADLTAQWKAEKDNQTGPLYDADGKLFPWVAADTEAKVTEWFSERMAAALRHRAEQRMTSTDGPLFVQLAEALLYWIRRLVRSLHRARLHPAPSTAADATAEILYNWLTGAVRSRDLAAQDWATETGRTNLPDWIADFWATYAKGDAFRFGTTGAKDPKEIARALSSPQHPLKAEHIASDHTGEMWRFKSKRGQITAGIRPDRSAWISASSARSAGIKDGGGAPLYQAALEWIHNNGATYETGNLTNINELRLTSAMLSSALRHGTTRHLKPDLAQQKIARWRHGEDAFNIAQLALAELGHFEAHTHDNGLFGLTFDPGTGSFITHDGKRITETDLENALLALGLQNDGIGIATAQRALLTRRAVSEYIEGRGTGGSGQADSPGLPAVQRLVGAAPRRLLYSRSRQEAARTRADLQEELAAVDDDQTALMRLRAKALERQQAGDLEGTRQLGEIDRSLKRLRARRGDLIAELGDLPEETQAPTPSAVTSGAAVPGMTAGNVTTPPVGPPPAPDRPAAQPAPQGPPAPPAAPAPYQIPADSKIALTVASTFRPPARMAAWVGHIKSLITGLKSPVPELPATGKDAELGRRLQNGYRRMRSATEQARWHAANAVANVLEPLTALNVPMEHEITRELADLQARLAEAKAKKLPPPQAILARHDELTRRARANPYHLFREAVLFRDLWFRGTLDSGRTDDAGQPIPVQLPFGLTVQDCQDHLTTIHAAIYSSPHREAIEESLRRHYQLAEDIKTGLLARGYIIPEELTNPFYFPHTILEKYSGRIARVKIDTKEDFRGYLQRLIGSAKAIETDYLLAMYKHAAEVFAHNLRQDIVEQYWKPYDIADDLKARANAKARAQGRRARPGEWRALIPEDYVAWQPDDTMPLRPEAIINRAELEKRLGVSLAEGDLKRQLAQMGITLTADDLTAALAAGRPEPWVLPAPIARALDAIIERETRETRRFWDPRGHLDTLINGRLMAFWKRWKLHAPTTAIRYNFNNLVSDLEKVWTVDPAVFTYLPRAFREVRQWFTAGDGTPEVRAAFRYGVLDTVTAGEIQRIGELPQFREFDTRGRQIAETASKALWWTTDVAQIREATFRYAKFLADLERIRAGKTPIYAGAYWRDAESEPTPYAMAARIARETFVDYQNISLTGEFLRRNLIPFYSWIEGNWRYHVNLFRNYTDLSAPIAGRQRIAQAARGAAAIPARLALPTSARGFALRLGFAFGLVTLWNAFVRARDDIEDDEISEEDRRRFHILLGRRSDGSLELIYAPTALTDILRFVGGNDLARLGGDVVAGRRSFPDAAAEWAARLPKDLFNQIVQGIRPEIKLATGALLRRDMFPDALDPRPIPAYDMRRFVLSQLTDPITAALIERSVNRDFYDPNTLGQWLNQMVLQIRRRDPEQWAYFAIRNEAEEWLAAQGRATEPFASDNPEAQLVRNFRTSLFRGDAAAAMKFFNRLRGMGYTQERLEATVRFQDPLALIQNKAMRAQFVRELPPHRRDMLNRAYSYYSRLRATDSANLFPTRKQRENPTDTTYSPADAKLALRAALRASRREATPARARDLLQESLTPSQ